MPRTDRMQEMRDDRIEGCLKEVKVVEDQLLQMRD